MCMDDYIAPLPKDFDEDDPVIFHNFNPYSFEPSTVVVEEDRGRQPSRAPTIVEVTPPPIRIPRSPCRRDSRSPSPSRSRSSSPRTRRPRSRRYSPARPCVINLPSPSPPHPIIMPTVPLACEFYPPPPSPVWPPQVVRAPTVDILTFKYKESMAYAPASKTYHEAIDIVLELWSELRDVDRDQIRLLVTGSDHLVRVPRMAWSAVLCDVPRYEVVHVQVEPVTPPPQYQGKGKGKGKWGDNNEKGRRSSGLFSSIRRVFGG